MERRDVSKQNVPALSYAAAKNINDAAYVTEMLKMAFCWRCSPHCMSPLKYQLFVLYIPLVAAADLVPGR